MHNRYDNLLIAPCVCVCVNINNISKSKGDRKASFSIATTPKCREGRYSFHWIAPLYPWYVPYIAEFLARKYQVPFLKSLVWHNLRLNPGLPDHWRTLYPLIYFSIFINKDCSISVTEYLLASAWCSVQSQEHIRGRKASAFAWATLRWAMMTSIVKQGSNLGSSPTTSPSTPTIINLWAIDLVLSPI